MKKPKIRKKLSMTSGAVRSRAYRDRQWAKRIRKIHAEAEANQPAPFGGLQEAINDAVAAAKKPPAPSAKVRGTVFQPWDVGQPTTMRQRIRDLAVAHMIRTSGQDLDYRARQKLLKSFDAELSALDETKPVPAKGHTPWNDQSGLAHAMKEIGPDNDTAYAAPFRPAEAEDFERPGDAIRDGLTTVPELIRAEAGELVPPGRTRSDVVAQMKAERDAPKQAGIVGQPIYSVETQDASKMRECLAECAKIIADAIVRGAKIIAAPETTTEPPVMVSGDDGRAWRPVGPGTPLGVWLQTAQIIPGPMGGTTTMGLNTCMCRILSISEEPEWIEKGSGVTTVTHHTFAPPTHWRWPAKQEKQS